MDDLTTPQQGGSLLQTRYGSRSYRHLGGNLPEAGPTRVATAIKGLARSSKTDIQCPRSVHSYTGVAESHLPTGRVCRTWTEKESVGTPSNYLSPAPLPGELYQRKRRHAKTIPQGVFRSGQSGR